MKSHRVVAVIWCVCGLGVYGAELGMENAEAAHRLGRTQVWALTLEQYLREVVVGNETLQARWLEARAARRRARGEWGAFEPEWFASAQRQINERQNTVEQQRSTLSGIFSERNNVYQGGLESLLPSGAKVRLGYTLRDLKNNLQSQPLFLSRGATNGEFVTFVGASVTQPLLKDAGPAATLAALRIAALESDIAFQEYRRQMMLTLAQAEDAYWNLFLAQEQVRYFEDSLATAEKLLQDNQKRLEAGRGSQLEVLEAEAGVALRRARLQEARQRLESARSQVLTFCSRTTAEVPGGVVALDAPRVNVAEPDLLELWREAWLWNPDYQIQRLKVMQEANRVGYQRNQRWPELNLVGSYGFNGLGETPGDSWAMVEDGGFVSWSIGLELRMPVAGGIKARNQLAAARLQYQAAELALREIERQIGNALEVARQKFRAARAGIEGYQALVAFNQTLLESALARLEVGKLDSRKVLEIEADLFEARNQLAETLVQRQRALLELEVVSGRLLKQRNLEESRENLAAEVRVWMQQPAASTLTRADAVAPAGFETPEQQRARQALRKTLDSEP
ncbi:MAG: TolC family protein [Verrucomicrobiota bacterium]|nr:TolC family protein [Limisphaera sp.]MDW8381420.1 TolC family protein [Verrucomicrobiota bacterium]